MTLSDWSEEDMSCIICLGPTVARVTLEFREIPPDREPPHPHAYCSDHLQLLIAFESAMQDMWLKQRALGNGG